MTKGGRVRDLIEPEKRVRVQDEATDTADRELDRFIERRGQLLKGEDFHVEDIWREQERRRKAEEREDNRLLWIGYFERLAETLRDRASDDRKATNLKERNNA